MRVFYFAVVLCVSNPLCFEHAVFLVVARGRELGEKEAHVFRTLSASRKVQSLGRLEGLKLN